MTFDRTNTPKRKATTPNKISFPTTKQDSLKAFGFREKPQTTPKPFPQQLTHSTTQTKIQDLKPFDTNESKGDTLNILDPNHIRIFYMNINGIELGKGGHSLLQLCVTLKAKGVDLVCLTETNVHWERSHVYHKFRQTLKEAWPKSKISFCTSESNIKWNSDSKPGGTAMFALNNISSAVLQKGQDPSGMGRWTFITILGKNNTRTSIFTMYRPCKGNIATIGDTTIIKQQWLVMQQTQRKEHPRDAAITDIIIAINKKRNNNHNIVLAIDSNVPFFNSSGGIARICRECQLFDPLDHKHGNSCDSKSFLRGSDRIDFLLCSFAILTTIIRCGMTGFNEVTTSDHCGFS